MALLVGGTLAAQASETRGVHDPPSALNKDGRCWKFSWAWWCLSWGTGHAPSCVFVSEVQKVAFAYDIVHSYVQKGVDLGFDMLGLFFDKPIQLWTIGMKYLSASVIAKLATLWKVVGIIITTLILNILAFIYLRVVDVILYLWKICKWIHGPPLILVVIGFFKCMYSFFVSIPDKV